MPKREYERYTWKDKKLYYVDIDTGARLHRNRNYPDMWHFKTSRDTVSDMFNLARAKDNGIKDDIADYNVRQSL